VTEIFRYRSSHARHSDRYDARLFPVARSKPALVARVIATVALAGVLIATLVTIAWQAVGAPDPASAAVWMQVTAAGSASEMPTPGQPFFFLAITTDDPGLMDGIHVIGVNPQQQKATILDISYDTQAYTGTKIDEAGAGQGLRAQADAVSRLVGVPIPYVVSTDFAGFAGMVNEIGGIDINIAQPMHDDYSGADFEPGPQHLNGDQAVAFGRDRYSFPTADLQRTQNGGLLILATLATLQSRHPSAGDAIHWIAALGRHIQLDGLGIADLFNLGRYALTIDPNNIRNVLLPVADGPGTILVPTPDAKSLLADFADDAVLENH
jgi:LCP family protein required for cell wall assembly